MRNSELAQGVMLARVLYGERASTWWDGRVRGDLRARLRLGEGRADPYPLYEQLRARGPMVATRQGSWQTVDHHVCREVLRSRTFGVVGVEGTPHPDDLPDVDLSFLGKNPPDHTRLRRLAAPAFSPRMMGRYTDLVDRTLDRLVENVCARGTFDLVDDLAAPLPIIVITEMLGVPLEDQRTFQQHGVALGSALDGLHSLRHAREVMAAVAMLETMFEGLFALREREPADDLVSTLVAARGDRIRPEELAPLCSLLLVAGFETTVNLIGNAVLALLAHPDQWDLLRADPDLAGACVEETLRWDPPVHETGRIAFQDQQIGGVTVRRDQWVFTLIGGANRDPDVFPDPARYDITRYAEGAQSGVRSAGTPAGEHLAFSGGIHYCIGAPLARMEATRALRTIAERLPTLHRAGPVTRRRSVTIRGPRHLPVAV